MNNKDGGPAFTLRQQLDQLRLGCHDTLSAFGPYRMMHGGYWVRHPACGWLTVSQYRYEAYMRAGSHPNIRDMEDCSDRFQVWAARLVTVIIGSLTGMAALVALT